MIHYGSSAYRYTPSGELSKIISGSDTTKFYYDALGNLLSVQMPGGPIIEYLIDGKNRRVGKKVNGILVQGFLYESQLEPVAELDGSGNIVSRFFYASKAHVPDLMIKDGVTYKIISDYLGSPRVIINSLNDSVIQRLNFDEFGNFLQNTNPGFQPFGYAGGIYDDHTKLTRFGARDYYPWSGRWTSKDPILFKSGEFNVLNYVNHDPINRIDPSGMYGTDDCSYYDQRCAEAGGEYYCETAPYYCDEKFPKPPDPDPSKEDDFEGWARCTRQCLQDCDRSQNPSPEDSPPQNTCKEKSNEDTDSFFDKGPTECHFICYTACFAAGQPGGKSPFSK